MKKRKLGIIGGSGLYKMEGFQKTKWKKINTPWGKPSDEILIASFGKEEICFIPRHSRGHKINPTNINYRANIDAMKQLGVTDIISVSAVGSLKENLEPGKFVIVNEAQWRKDQEAFPLFDGGGPLPLLNKERSDRTLTTAYPVPYYYEFVPDVVPAAGPKSPL